jgi:hypothetical protein
VIDKTVHLGLLLDFYGQLLTEKQRLYFTLYHQEDLSLGEIAEQYGVTRQAVYDILQRSQKTLMDLEGKLGLEKRYALQRERLELIQTRLLDLTKGSLGQVEGKALEELVALEQLVAQLIEDS